jgi:hypothetical protein
MLEAAKYSAIDLLRNGRRIEIRALRPEDRTELVAAVGRSSAQSLYRRFFGLRRHFTEQEIAFFTNVDFINHVALVVVTEENGRPEIIGGGRYVVLQPGKAEVAFAVVDEYQGQGIGAGAHAPPRRDCPGGWAQRASRGCPLGQHSDAESVREERIARKHQARTAGRTRHP